MKLDYSHVEYVLHCLEGNTSKIKNIKKYLLAALFNAPSTIPGEELLDAAEVMQNLREKHL